MTDSVILSLILAGLIAFIVVFHFDCKNCEKSERNSIDWKTREEIKKMSPKKKGGK